MSVLPLQFQNYQSAQSIGLTGGDVLSIVGLAGSDAVPDQVTVRAQIEDRTCEFPAQVRIDTPAEADYFRHGGILPYVLRHLPDAGDH